MKPWGILLFVIGVGFLLILSQGMFHHKEDQFNSNPGTPALSDNLRPWKFMHNPFFPPPKGKAEKVGDIVFIKGFKTASTTVASIFFRFGFRHGLKFMFTQTSYWGLDPFKDQFPDNPYNIHLQHLVTNLPFNDMVKFFRSHITNPRFITTIRQPFAQRLSAFNFLWAPNEANSTIEYFIEKNPYGNHQAEAFGIFNKNDLEIYLPKMDELFMVLIAEKLEESLVLMKRKLNWELYDVLFINLLVTCRDNKDQKGDYIPCADKSLLERPDVKKAFKEQLSIDQALYDHFLQKHEREVAKQDESFFQEVQDLKDANLWLQDFCAKELQAFTNDQKSYFQTYKGSFCFKYIMHESGYERLLRDFDPQFYRAFMVESIIPATSN